MQRKPNADNLWRSSSGETTQQVIQTKSDLQHITISWVWLIYWQQVSLYASLVWVNIALNINLDTEIKTLYLYILIDLAFYIHMYSCIPIYPCIHTSVYACTCNMPIYMRLYKYKHALIHAIIHTPIWTYTFMRNWGIVRIVRSFTQIEFIHADRHTSFHCTCSVRYCRQSLRNFLLN